MLARADGPCTILYHYGLDLAPLDKKLAGWPRKDKRMFTSDDDQ